MDYEELRKYQRKEKNTTKLVELKPNFYKEVGEYITKLESKYEEEMDPEIKHKIQNIRKITEDLHRRRERKIMTRVLGSIKTIEDFNLIEREKTLFKQLKKTIKKEREQLNQILQGKKPIPKQQQKQPEKTTQETKSTEEQSTEEKDTEETLKTPETTDQETEETDEGLNKVMVKILKEVPEFVSQNLQKLGPYKPDSKVKLPEKEAEILTEKGLAKKINKKEE